MAVYSEKFNSIYIFGGVQTSDLTYNTVYKWNLNQPKSWFFEIGTTPTTDFYSGTNNAVLIGDLIYFIGVGTNTSSTPPTTGEIFLFNTSDDSWIDGSDLSSPPNLLVHGCLTTNTTHIFMVDGWPGNHDPKQPVLQIYDINADSWSSSFIGSNEPWTIGGWRYQYCSLIDNKLFIMGGRIGWKDGKAEYIDNITKYDIDEGMFSTVHRLPIPSAWGIAAFHDDMIYLVGRYPETANIFTFDVGLESLSSITYNMTQAIRSPAVVVINDELWIFGGRDLNDDATDNVEVCSLPESTTSPSTNTPTTSIPTTMRPSTMRPTTMGPTTMRPTWNPSLSPTTASPTTEPTKFTSVSSGLPTMAVLSATPTEFISVPTQINNGSYYGINITVMIRPKLDKNMTNKIREKMILYAVSINDLDIDCVVSYNINEDLNFTNGTLIEGEIDVCEEEQEIYLISVYNNVTKLKQDIIDIAGNVTVDIIVTGRNEDFIENEGGRDWRYLIWGLLVGIGIAWILCCILIIIFMVKKKMEDNEEFEIMNRLEMSVPVESNSVCDKSNKVSMISIDGSEELQLDNGSDDEVIYGDQETLK